MTDLVVLRGVVQEWAELSVKARHGHARDRYMMRQPTAWTRQIEDAYLLAHRAYERALRDPAVVLELLDLAGVPPAAAQRQLPLSDPE